MSTTTPPAVDQLAAGLAELREAAKSNSADIANLVEAMKGLVTADTGEHGGARRPAAPANAEPILPEGGLKGLLSRKATNDQEREFQALSDRVLLAATILRCDPKSLKCYRDLQVSAKALNTATDAAGADFVPTGYSTQLIDEIRIERKLAGLCDRVTIPRSPFKWPVAGSSSLGVLIAEPTNDTAALVPAQTPTTLDTTFDAKTIGTRIAFSQELDEDSIVAVEQYVRQSIVKAVEDSIETALLNGDTTATHMDGVVTASNDCRKAWKGFRRLAIDASATYDTATNSSPATTAWEQGDVPRILKKLSAQYRFAGDLVLVISSAAMCKMLETDTTNWASFASIDKIGSQALNVVGQVGQIYGIPVIISPYMSDTLHTDGKDTGLGTASGAVIFNRRAFALATQRGLVINTVYDPEALQYRLVGSMRADFQPWRTIGSTDLPVGYGIKVAVA